jgi:peroxiredoxin Q/BCP
MAKQLKIGDAAPEFVLQSQTGEAVELNKLLARKKDIVLYFYPKDNTPGCTTEARAFRDSYEIFKQMGADVIGVSSDTVDSHRDFATKCELPFTILSDREGKVRRLYGASGTFGLLPGRVTYIIDTKGIVRHIFSSQMNPKKHVEEAVKVLTSISEEEGRETKDSTGRSGV